MRTAPGKTDCLILDRSDTTLRLGFVSDIHHERLDTGRKADSSSTKREKRPSLPKECPSCSFLKPAGIHACPACGFAPERQSGITEREGSLVQLNGKRKDRAEATPHDRQQFYSMLICYQQERGYKHGFVLAKYKARFGTWPSGLLEAPVEPTPPSCAG